MHNPSRHPSRLTGNGGPADNLDGDRREALQAAPAFASLESTKIRGFADLYIEQPHLVAALGKQLSRPGPFAPAVRRILDIVDEPRTSADALSHALSLDEGLTQRVLRIANSASVGLPRTIGSIKQAVILLGFSSVRNMALAVSTYELLTPNENGIRLDRARLWQHSVAAAAAAGVIAECRPKCAGGTETEFLAGLMHDLGKLFLDLNFPTSYGVALQYARHQGISEVWAEQRIMLVDHAAVGSMLVERLRYPPEIVAAVGAHHCPDTCLVESAIVHAADWMAWKAGFGSADGATGPDLSPQVARWLEISDDEIDRIWPAWERAYESTWSVLGDSPAA